MELIIRAWCHIDNKFFFEWNLQDIQDEKPFHFSTVDWEYNVFTTLFDSFWNKIYQWDILELTDYNWKSFLVQCIWGNIWGWLFIMLDYPCSLIDVTSFSYYNDGGNQSSKVIWNIYENKDLISNTKMDIK